MYTQTGKQRTHDHKRENKGKGQEEGPQTRLQAVQDVTMGVTLSSGSLHLDTLLNGGIQTCSITEIFGGVDCGKTAFAHHMCVRVQLPLEKGGLEGKVGSLINQFLILSLYNLLNLLRPCL